MTTNGLLIIIATGVIVGVGIWWFENIKRLFNDKIFDIKKENKKALGKKLKDKAKRRANYYNLKLKELGISCGQFAENDLLIQQLDDEFNLIEKKQQAKFADNKKQINIKKCI